jgi:hypothetical protein
MELRELIDELRSNRLDDTVAKYLWTDEELTGYLNDAVRQVCIRQRLLVESTNTSITQYTLTAGQKLFALHPSILAVRTLRTVESDGTQHDCLEGKTVRWVRERHPRFETWDNGRPHYWIPDYQQNAILLDRGCDNVQTVNLTCWRMPLDIEKLDVNDMTSEPCVSEIFHLDLCDWATYRAFQKKDAEALDDGRSDKAAESFNAKIGPLPSAAAIRLWGISPVIGTKPQFV